MPAPATPTNIQWSALDHRTIRLSWTNASGLIGTTQIEYSANGSTGWQTLALVDTYPAGDNIYLDENLTPQQTRYYRFRFWQQVSNPSGYSLVVTASTPALAPPAQVTATATLATRILLSWQFNSLPLYYLIEQSPDGLSWSSLVTLDSDDFGYEDNSLPPATQRYYRVRAQDSAYPIYWSAWVVVNATTPQLTTPTNVVGQALSPTSGRITFASDPPTGHGFRVQKLIGATWTLVANTSNTALAVTDTALAPGISTSYRVRAYSGSYVGPVSATVVITTPALTIPANFGAVANGATEVNIAWTNATPNNGTAIQIQRAPGGTTNWSTITIVANNIQSYRDRTVAPSTQYHYRAFTYLKNAYDGTPTATATVTTVAIETPSDLVVVAISVTELSIAWQPSQEQDVSATQLEYSQDGGTTWSILGKPTIEGVSVNYTHVGLISDTPYWYRARNIIGSFIGGACAPVDGRTLALIAPTVQVTNVTTTTITLSWSDPNTGVLADIGYEVQSYHVSGWQTQAILAVGVHTITLTGRIVFAPYTFRVRALPGGPWSAEVTTYTAYEPTFTLSENDQHQLVMSWPEQPGTVETMHIEWSTDGIEWTDHAIISPTVGEAILPFVRRGYRYALRVAACDARQVCAWSEAQWYTISAMIIWPRQLASIASVANQIRSRIGDEAAVLISDTELLAYINDVLAIAWPSYCEIVRYVFDYNAATATGPVSIQLISNIEHVLVVRWNSCHQFIQITKYTYDPLTSIITLDSWWPMSDGFFIVDVMRQAAPHQNLSGDAGPSSRWIVEAVVSRLLSRVGRMLKVDYAFDVQQAQLAAASEVLRSARSPSIDEAGNIR